MFFLCFSSQLLTTFTSLSLAMVVFHIFLVPIWLILLLNGFQHGVTKSSSQVAKVSPSGAGISSLNTAVWCTGDLLKGTSGVAGRAPRSPQFLPQQGTAHRDRSNGDQGPLVYRRSPEGVQTTGSATNRAGKGQIEVLTVIPASVSNSKTSCLPAHWDVKQAQSRMKPLQSKGKAPAASYSTQTHTQLDGIHLRVPRELAEVLTKPLSIICKQ